MASATATARSDAERARPARRRLPLVGSRLGRLIVGLNLLGLLVLLVGALAVNEFRRGLIEARIDSLTTQGQLIAYVIEKAATEGDPQPEMEAEKAREILHLMEIPPSERARLYGPDGRLIADTDIIADKVLERPLPPALKPGARPFRWPWQMSDQERQGRAHADEVAEVATAIRGDKISGVRMAETGGRLVSVSIPIQHVQAVLGVLTLEAGDVDQIVAAQRRALLPFVLIAVAVTLISSLLLTTLVAQPVLRLARAADSVRLSRARAISLPDIEARQDEIGDLARALESMTSALSARMGAIERFAADVSHEIKNPLTSIRSAVETLELSGSSSDASSARSAREKLIGILKQDVGRLDRLITDISNASRLDAELSREAPRVIDLGRFLADIAALYPPPQGPEGVAVRFTGPAAQEPFHVSGREGPLGQVFRNLIDNARSFSPPGGTVSVGLTRERDEEAVRCIAVAVEDQGPGVPADNLESIFQRFYTARPKGQSPGGSAFGGHSGLGLSIARQIVEAHGGRIRAENRPEGGARFTVLLPESRA